MIQVRLTEKRLGFFRNVAVDDWLPKIRLPILLVISYKEINDLPLYAPLEFVDFEFTHKDSNGIYYYEEVSNDRGG